MFLNLDQKERNSVAAIDSKGIMISYGELVDETICLSENVKNRSIVLCLCENTIDMLVGYLAFIEGRSVPLLLSADTDRTFVKKICERYQPQYIYAPRRILNKEIPEIFYQGEYSLYQTQNERYPLNDNLALLMSTSGSTGSPKFVRYTRKNLEANAQNVARAFNWTAKERALIDLSMAYTMGLNVINTHLYVGAELLMTTDNIMSPEYWDFIKEYDATNITGVPFSYELMLKLRFTDMDLPYLTTLAQGGGMLPDKDFEKLAVYAEENGKRFIATFGTTETAARMTLLPADMAVIKTGSIGKAIPEGEAFLIDDDGRKIETPDKEGELCYRGPNVTMGYAENAGDLIKGDEFCGEYHTGDLAKYDEDGYYYITGRKARFLKLTGHRVSLDDCEKMVENLFETECACTGTDRGMDIYVTCSGCSDEIAAMLSSRTGLQQALFTVHETDIIPRNGTGKILYSNLL